MNLNDFVINENGNYTVTVRDYTFDCKGLLDKVRLTPDTSLDFKHDFERYEIHQVKLLLASPDSSADVNHFLTKLYYDCQRSYHRENFGYKQDFVLENENTKVRLEECAVSYFEDNILILEVCGKMIILK